MSQIQMTPVAQKPHSDSWVLFTYVSFAASLAMVGGGILLMDAPVLAKAYLAIGMLMLVQSCMTLTKTLRDNHENQRFINRLEEARTDALLAQAGFTGPVR